MRAGRARPASSPRCPLAAPTRRHLVTGRDHVIDSDPPVGKSRTIPAHRALEHLRSTNRTRLSRLSRIVVDRVRCDQLISQLKVAVVEALLQRPARSTGKILAAVVAVDLGRAVVASLGTSSTWVPSSAAYASTHPRSDRPPSADPERTRPPARHLRAIPQTGRRHSVRPATRRRSSRLANPGAASLIHQYCPPRMLSVDYRPRSIHTRQPPTTRWVLPRPARDGDPPGADRVVRRVGRRCAGARRARRQA